MQFVSRAEFEYQHNQSINFDAYQRCFENGFFKFQNDKYLYYFCNNYILKKNFKIVRTT